MKSINIGDKFGRLTVIAKKNDEQFKRSIRRNIRRLPWKKAAAKRWVATQLDAVARHDDATYWRNF